MIDGTNRTTEESLSRYVCELRDTWSEYLPFAIIAYSFSFLFVAKYSSFFTSFRATNCSAVSETVYTNRFFSINYALSEKNELQWCPEVVRESLDIESMDVGWRQKLPTNSFVPQQWKII